MTARALPMNSIKRKLTRLVGLSVGSACLMMGGASCWQELSHYAVFKQQDLQSAASAFGAATAGALARHDRNAAQQSLRGIASLPGYRYASVRGPEGYVLAEVGSGARLARDLTMVDQDGGLSPWSLFLTGTVAIDDALFDNGRPVGRLQLISDASDIRWRLLGVGTSAIGAALVALLASMMIARRMQRSLTDPLFRLTAVMAEVRQTQRYDVEVDVKTDDEIDVLAKAFAAMLSDVRERDARLLGHQQRLEADVADRTRDLAAAKQEADAANAAKSDFLATMSHEIRTPMNGLMVMADLLARTELPAGPRRYAEVIAQSGRGLLAIINDILDFSKIEAGKLTVEAVPFDPVEVVDRVLALQASRAEERGLDLACHRDPRMPREITGDPARFGQIVSNLVGNALKFTSSGSVVVRLALEGCDLVLSVTDTGIGIPADKIDQIFDAFAQAEQSTTRRFGGTGLGLSICRRLAEAMGGSITATSTEGRGSTFTLAIPGAVATEPGPASLPTPRPERILLDVEGAATRAALAEALAAGGYRTTAEATEATHAIVDADRLQRRRDRVVPGRIVALAAASALPGRDGRAGTDRVVAKPVSRADLQGLVAFFSGQDDASVAGAEAAARPGARTFRGLAVLVVDDGDLNLEVARAALEQFGVAVDTCGSGREAIARVFANRYHLVLMDGSMPDLDGYETTRRIRAREAAEQRDRTRIVALTAHVVGPVSEAWSACGMDGVLHKPFTLEALAATLAEASGDLGEAAPAGLADRTDEAPEVLLDPVTLDNLREMSQRSGHAFIGRIVGLFVAECPKTCAALDAAAARGDAEGIAAAAHKLKSMSLNMGARRLAAELQAIESEARAHGALPGPDALAALREIMDATVRDLQSALSAPDAGQPDDDRSPRSMPTSA